MTEFQISDRILHNECESIAKEIFAEVTAEMDEGETPADYRDDMMDLAHEAADGHNWVIYNYKALKLCADCSLEYGEDFLSDVGFEWGPDSTIYSVATMIAYGEIRGRVECILSEMIEEAETEAA